MPSRNQANRANGYVPGACVIDHRVPQIEPVILAIEIAHRHLHTSARFPLARHGNRHCFHQHLRWQSGGDLGCGGAGTEGVTALAT